MRINLPVMLPLAAAVTIAVSPVSAASIDEICKMGETEPQLVWYSSQGPALAEAAVAAFAKVYPKIPVEQFRLATGALTARYASERDGGVINADLITMGDPNFSNAGFEKGWFVQFEKSELPAVARLEDRWFDRGAAMTNINVLGIAYNTDITGANPPKGWEDLLRPEYKGKLTLGDPRNVPSYMALYRILRDKYGPDYLKKLAAQEPVFFKSIVPGTQQLAAGAFAIAAPSVESVHRPVEEKGAPIKSFVPAMTTGNEFWSLLSVGADSPNAAKCFYNFLFTEAGQVAYGGDVSVSPFPDTPVTDSMPTEYRNPEFAELPKHAANVLELLNLR